ncbi:MAG: NAD(P)/FAD-dependent oxidoreductase [Syntrophomonadaceae bacterium]
MHSDTYDLVVVGAGPAGASAARAAGHNGVQVLLIDARTNPGSPVQCAEYVPNQVRGYVPLVKGAVVQKIDTLLTFINDELASTLAGPGYMLDRRVFDAGLVDAAREAGAEVCSSTKAIAKTEHGLIVSHNCQEPVAVKCRVIIGADGPRSTVGEWMNSRNQNFMVGLQYNLPLSQPQYSTDIYFKPEYHGGYAWLFPKGWHANVGVGVSLSHKERLPRLLDEFITRLVWEDKIRGTRPAAKTSGLIPVGGPIPITQTGNMLLAGDAAGLAHPVTGGGIMNAIVSGQIAGQTAAQAIEQNDLKVLSQYPQRWQEVLGRFLDRGVQQRLKMDRGWTEDRAGFERLIKRTWISFN